jgi:hypothetical protein
MKNVQLKFDSLLNLWRFKEKVQPVHVQVNVDHRVLSCELSEEEILLATDQYKAEVVTALDVHPYSS